MKRAGGATAKALLGLLSIGPMSGYDLRQLIPWSIGQFWNESYGQIYPALKQMTADGLVERETERACRNSISALTEPRSVWKAERNVSTSLRILSHVYIS